jgi:hypothetical protein
VSRELRQRQQRFNGGRVVALGTIYYQSGRVWVFAMCKSKLLKKKTLCPAARARELDPPTHFADQDADRFFPFFEKEEIKICECADIVYSSVSH